MDGARKQRSGFTLIETIVVIGITAVLAGVVLGYSRSSERQVVLLTEREKTMAFVNRARSLALARDAAEKDVCGYGVAFGGRSLSLYRQTLESGSCDPAGGDVVDTLVLAGGLSFDPAPRYAFFTAPYLSVKSDADFPAKFTMRDAQSGAAVAVEVAGGGMVGPVNP